MTKDKRNFIIKKLIIFAVFVLFCLLLVVFAFNDELFDFKNDRTSSTVSFQYLTSSKSETINDISDNHQENETDCVNINTATAEELMTLKGIGQKKAEAIVEYRNTIGLFRTKEDIMNVSGIGQSTYNNIKDNIRVK
jgi:comEA protein